MKIRLFSALVLLLGFRAGADDSADRTKLMGKWQSQDEATAEQKPSWNFNQVGDAIRVSRFQGEQKVAEFECKLGAECEVKDSGHKVKVSWWFNGSKLVELETKGTDVTKRRFSFNGPVEGMQLESIPIVPSGKTEILHFKRVTE